MKHIIIKFLGVTVSLKNEPISKPKSIENYDKEYAINCVQPSNGLNVIHGSINSNAIINTNEPLKAIREDEHVERTNKSW